MSVKIGYIELVGSGFSLPRERARAKRTLKSIAKLCGVKKVYFVRTTKAPYGGFYRLRDQTIVVVEQYKQKKAPMWLVTFRFFHELTHHLHIEAGLFKAFYFSEAKVNGKRKKFTPTDRRRVALRAENHANQKACELAYEFFGWEFPPPPKYSKDFLRVSRGDLFG